MYSTAHDNAHGGRVVHVASSVGLRGEKGRWGREIRACACEGARRRRMFGTWVQPVRVTLGFAFSNQMMIPNDDDDDDDLG